MKFVTKVKIKKYFYIARSRIRGEYLIRVNGGNKKMTIKWTTKLICKTTNKWSVVGVS